MNRVAPCRRPTACNPAATSDEIVMPDSSDEARAAAGVRVGSLTVVRGSGPRPTVEVFAEDGKTLRGEAALTAIFDALKAEADAHQSSRAR